MQTRITVEAYRQLIDTPNNESELQSRIVDILRENHFVVFSVPNGGKRHPAVGAKLKREGVLKGVSDTIIVMDNDLIFLEIKMPGEKQSLEQKIFQEIVELLGHTYLLWESVQECRDWIKFQPKQSLSVAQLLIELLKPSKKKK